MAARDTVPIVDAVEGACPLSVMPAPITAIEAGRRLVLLLVEDNPADALLIEEMLLEIQGDGEASFELVVAGRLEEAASCLKTLSPDLVLLDLLLPDGNGMALFDSEGRLLRGVPVVVLTGVDDRELALRAVRSGAQDYLVKGRIDCRVLLRVIRYAIERHRMVHELDTIVRRLQASEARARQIIEMSADGIVVLNHAGQIRFVNPAAEAMFGRSCSELNQVPFGLPGAPSEKTEIDIVRKDHPSLVAEMRAVELMWDGEPAWLASLRDITKRRHAEEEVRRLNAELEQRVSDRTRELVAANKDLEAFTYSVSHDLRAPLRHLSGFSDLLLEELSGSASPPARHYLERIRGGAQQMGRMVDELLQLSRLGRQELACQVTDLGAVVRQVIADLEQEAIGRQVEWRVRALPYAVCDAQLMVQVFTNLLANALKFTRPRPVAVIDVESFEQDGQTLIAVRDNGVGFSMNHAQKLFGAFQRLHRTEDFEGTGVGLATVKRIIGKHGGQVWAEAELGVGASFYFTLAGVEHRVSSRGQAIHEGANH